MPWNGSCEKSLSFHVHGRAWNKACCAEISLGFVPEGEWQIQGFWTSRASSPEHKHSSKRKEANNGFLRQSCSRHRRTRTRRWCGQCDRRHTSPPGSAGPRVGSARRPAYRRITSEWSRCRCWRSNPRSGRCRRFVGLPAHVLWHERVSELLGGDRHYRRRGPRAPGSGGVGQHLSNDGFADEPYRDDGLSPAAAAVALRASAELVRIARR